MNTLDDHRRFWADIAREKGWYASPFHVMVWTASDGRIIDSVSYRGLDRDIELPANC